MVDAEDQDTSQDQASDLLWYVVHTKPHKELMVTSLLEEQLDLEIYLPEVLQTYRGKLRPRPFFPRYLFARIDLGITESTAINSTVGVLRLVSFGERPLPLDSGVVASIRTEVDRLNAQGGLPAMQYQEGETVRLLSGPLKGMEAVFVRHLHPRERVVILLRFLGQQNEIEVDLSQIERTSPVRRRRGTRGKGRKINY